ncbi:winged helix-turn-helix domain-containing protein [Natrarchaeobius oligotrophus]|uniref:ArsR family transcriptional regulator n=1 Tax=Natrarchaeobius chitinivorans TaxID=1679083 RepID=A0A3N6M9J6_NATCH|nr:winged helix-turn-helix domain-containing protein [Natrarchaeobius chitinivorans]RQH00399.1 ArsR family transcriptional regulator [Natrarchaeobius chitinivorans]
MSLEPPPTEERVDLERIVGALDDEGCREIVSALEEPMTVDEIAETVDRPLSTCYRKLDRLTEAGLVDEATGVRNGSHSKSRYVTNFERIAIELDENRELRARVDRVKNHVLQLWSEVRREF